MHTPDFTLPTQSNVDGHIYRLYTFNFETNDGMRSAYFYAINDEHAHHVLTEMCESADLTSLAAIYGQS